MQQETDSNGTLLGQFTYDNTGEPLQTFQVMVQFSTYKFLLFLIFIVTTYYILQEKNPGVYPIVELRVHSNHGNLNYTCLYRFRVHGQVVH